MLGSPASDPDRAVVEGPQKRVEIPAPFAIGLFPVLCYEYQAAVGQLPSVVDPPVAQSRALFGRSEPPSATAPVGVNSLASAPVTFVSFDDALTFVGRLTTATGETYHDSMEFAKVKRVRNFGPPWLGLDRKAARSSKSIVARQLAHAGRIR